MMDETTGKLGLYVGLSLIEPPAFAVDSHPLHSPDLKWPDFVYIRRPAMDTGTCTAAICPQGGVELERFLKGAKKRGEVALGLQEMAGTSSGPVGFSLPYTPGTILAELLPQGVFPHLGDGLSAEDKDLALRIRGNKDVDWSALTPQIDDESLFIPLLVDALGQALAAVWIPKGPYEQRWYILPFGCRWESLIDWVVHTGIPAFVPEAANRVHELAAINEDFRTRDEQSALQELGDFEEEARVQRERLRVAAERAEQRASTIRVPLLYHSGDDLKAAVASVLTTCGFAVEDLDKTFGEPLSADLLASRNGKHWLVESKASSGHPGEDEISSVVKHVRTWVQLGRPERLEHAVMILNHHLRRPPPARPRAPYSRMEFINSLPDFGISVIGTMALCKWWATADCSSLIEAVTGPPGQYSS